MPAGADVTLDLRFEAVSEGVLVTGSAVAPLTGECARCLDPVSSTMEVSFQELYLYQPGAGEDEDDDEERFLNGDLLDLEPRLPGRGGACHAAFTAVPGRLPRAVPRVRCPPRRGGTRTMGTARTWTPDGPRSAGLMFLTKSKDRQES